MGYPPLLENMLGQSRHTDTHTEKEEGLAFHVCRLAGLAARSRLALRAMFVVDFTRCVSRHINLSGRIKVAPRSLARQCGRSLHYIALFPSPQRLDEVAGLSIFLYTGLVKRIWSKVAVIHWIVIA